MSTTIQTSLYKQDSGYETFDTNQSCMEAVEKSDLASSMAMRSVTDGCLSKDRHLPLSNHSGSGDVIRKDTGKPKTRSESRVTFSDIECDTPSTNASHSKILVTDKNEVITNFDISQPRNLHRTVSIESRDNPFLPNGDLSRETEELLRRVKIVGGKFIILNDEVKNEGKTEDEQQKDAALLASGDVLAISEELVRSTEVQPTQANKTLSQKNKNHKLNGITEPSRKNDDKTPNDGLNDSTQAKVKDKDRGQRRCCTIL